MQLSGLQLYKTKHNDHAIQINLFLTTWLYNIICKLFNTFDTYIIILC